MNKKIKNMNNIHVAITGASKGIGFEVANKLKSQGCIVTVFDIIEPEFKVDKFVKVDFSNPIAIQDTLFSINDKYDALINNAGIPPKEGQEAKILMVNFIGLKLFYEGMLNNLNEGASIVNTSSRAGSMWNENLDQIKSLINLKVKDLKQFINDQNINPVRAYNLSKEALIVLTISETKKLLSKNLRMNSVCPAAVSTDIHQDFMNAFGDKVVKNIAKVGRPATPKEIADLIIYLISPQSFWIKGQNIIIDGGMSSIIMSETLSI